MKKLKEAWYCFEKKLYSKMKKMRPDNLRATDEKLVECCPLLSIFYQFHNFAFIWVVSIKNELSTRCWTAFQRTATASIISLFDGGQSSLSIVGVRLSWVINSSTHQLVNSAQMPSLLGLQATSGFASMLNQSAYYSSERSCGSPGEELSSSISVLVNPPCQKQFRMVLSPTFFQVSLSR